MREMFDDWMKRENDRLDRLNNEMLDRGIADEFMRGEVEGKCPYCGGDGESLDSDEGPTHDHWLQRFYKCTECGAKFTEQFRCVPECIWLTDV